MWDMRASPKPDAAALATTLSDSTAGVGTRSGLSRPVVWLLWLLGALLGSVILGFLAGLARPREPDPWSYGPDVPAENPAAEPPETPAEDPPAAASPDAQPSAVEDV